MAKRLPTIYLAGAIRNNRPDDIIWREEIIRRLDGLAIFLNPLAGKKYYPDTGIWTIYGDTVSGADYIVKKDFWSVDRTDMIIFNLLCLAEGYPAIGSLIEFGRATNRSTMLYTIVPKEYTGHTHEGLYNLHPFIEKNSTMVFHDVESCVNFLVGELMASSGIDPHFGGTS